ncbi:MAG: hypothetical protein V3U03_13440 [Myxococcota bacterium]
MRVLALLASAVVAAAAAAQVPVPGLEETLDRLQEQMALYAKPRTRDFRGTTESSYSFTARDGCLVELAKTSIARSREDDSETRTVATTRLHLGELQPDAVKILGPGKAGWTMSAKLKDEYVDLLEKQSRSKDSAPAVEKDRPTRSIAIEFTISSMARNSGRALRHAILLCEPEARPEKRKT